MINIFGSLHIDSNESPELKEILGNTRDKSIIVAVELTNNKQTRNALKRFGELSDFEIDKVLEQHFGKRRVIASFNFMKMLRNYENIQEVISIEPKSSQKLTELSRNAWVRDYSHYDKFFEHLQSHPEEPEGPEKLLRLYSRYIISVAKQCLHREKNMVKEVTQLAETNTDKDVLVYCSFIHAAHIQNTLRSSGIRFKTRENSHVAILEENDAIVRSASASDRGIKLNPTNISSKDSLEFAREMILERMIWTNRQQDASITQYYETWKEVTERIKKLPDYKRVIVDMSEFRASVQKKLKH